MSECGNCGSPAAFALDVCAPCEQSARDAEANQREVERMAYELVSEFPPGWLRDQYGHGRTFHDSLRAAYAAAFGGRDGE